MGVSKEEVGVDERSTQPPCLLEDCVKLTVKLRPTCWCQGQGEGCDKCTVSRTLLAWTLPLENPRNSSNTLLLSPGP